MKKMLVILFFCLPTLALAGSEVKKIEEIGDSHYRVTCTSGSERAVKRMNGRWNITSVGGGYIGYEGSKYDSMSVNEIASYMCKSLG